MITKNFISGHYEVDNSYKYFVPSKVNIEWIITNPEINTLNEDAGRLLGELNGFSQLIPDIDFFISMHITKEAQTSSKIEGTKTNLDEAILPEENIDPERIEDWEEVQNYIQAMNYAIKRLDDLPLSIRLIRETHNVLLQGVRGRYKQPGELRQSQNWIGGASLADATFIPPAHHYLPELLSDLEQFLHNTVTPVPNLIKIAIAHYQFETIHPFLDGNGRIGRLLITLFLVNKKLLNKPTLYLSNFFEQNRQLYYDNLNNARVKNDVEQWLKFFLIGIIETSKSSIETLKSIVKLRARIESIVMIKFSSRVENVQQIINYLYKNPVINGIKVQKLLNTTKPTANKLLSDLVKCNILVEISNRKRSRVYIFREYLDIFIDKKC